MAEQQVEKVPDDDSNGIGRITQLPCMYCGVPLNETFQVDKLQQYAIHLCSLMLHRACIEVIKAMSADQLHLSLAANRWHFWYEPDDSEAMRELRRNNDTSCALHFYAWLHGQETFADWCKRE